jgi:hypothetical protein
MTAYTTAQVQRLPVQIPRTAWTGGSAPDPLRAITRRERGLVRAEFREQARTFADYWGRLPLDAARVLWIRARHDAHASIRAAVRAGLTRGAA